jgi:hypothetical protein
LSFFCKLCLSSGNNLVDAVKKVGKPFPVPGMGFIICQASFNDCHHLFAGIQARHFQGQTGMPAQTASQQNTKPGLSRLKGPARADMDTFTASLASIPVNDRFFVSIRAVCQPDGLIRATLNTGIAAAAVVIPHPWSNRSDDADISDLGPGTGIGAITEGDTECLVGLYIIAQRPS